MWRFDIVYDAMLIGCVLALLMQSRRAEVILNSRWLNRDRFAISLVFLLVLSFSDCFWEIPKIQPFVVTIRLACVAGVINRVIRTPHGWITSVLEMRLVTWLGRLSYSLYLWQQLFIMDVSAPRWLSPRFPLSLIPILLAATFSYYVIERPLQKLREQLGPDAQRGSTEAKANMTELPRSVECAR